jgi:phosphoglycerate dehydrogenase-like enzyme
MILALARNIAADDAHVKAGRWQTMVTTGLTGKTFGCVGFGRLGAAVSTIMSAAFGMKIVAWSASLTQESADTKCRGAGLVPQGPDGEARFKVVSKEELFRSADVVSLHYVLSARSRGIVGAHELAAMKPTAMLVNTARSGLVEEQALLSTLRAGRIRGAAIDVYEQEPLPVDSEWRNFPWGEGKSGRVLLTPHMGFVEEETLASWYDELVVNLENWVVGRELNDRIA